MKTLAFLGAAALASLGVSSQASAYEFQPKNTSFVGTGSTNLTKGVFSASCTAKFTGKTNAAGVGHVTAATFSGSSSLCAGIEPTGLPWRAAATSATQAIIYNVSVSASVLGSCGPTNVPVTVSKTGVITFNGVVLTPNCTVKGNITTKPRITIVK